LTNRSPNTAPVNDLRLKMTGAATYLLKIDMFTYMLFQIL